MLIGPILLWKKAFTFHNKLAQKTVSYEKQMQVNIYNKTKNWHISYPIKF